MGAAASKNERLSCPVTPVMKSAKESDVSGPVATITASAFGVFSSRPFLSTRRLIDPSACTLSASPYTRLMPGAAVT